MSRFPCGAKLVFGINPVLGTTANYHRSWYERLVDASLAAESPTSPTLELPPLHLLYLLDSVLEGSVLEGSVLEGSVVLSYAWRDRARFRCPTRVDSADSIVRADWSAF